MLLLNFVWMESIFFLLLLDTLTNIILIWFILADLCSCSSFIFSKAYYFFERIDYYLFYLLFCRLSVLLFPYFFSFINNCFEYFINVFYSMVTRSVVSMYQGVDLLSCRIFASSVLQDNSDVFQNSLHSYQQWIMILLLPIFCPMF